MKNVLPSLVFAFVIFSCSNLDQTDSGSQEEIAAESAKANRIYQEYFDELVSMQPEFQTRLGIKTDYDKWDDISDQHQLVIIDLKSKYFKKLQDSVNKDLLDDYARLAYDDFEIIYQGVGDEKKYELYDYPVNQMYGVHTNVVTTLTNQHNIDSLKDAEDYISRVRTVSPLFDQLIKNLKIREEHGIVLPQHLFDKVIETCRNLTADISKESSENHLLYKDFKSKIDSIDIDDETRANLLANLGEALQANFKPSYEKLISFLEDQKTRSVPDEGAWKFPDGDHYYQYRLKLINSIPITPDEVYELGLKEVERIQNEIQVIMDEVRYEGSVQDFLAHMREDDQFYLETTPENKEFVLDSLRSIVNGMWTKIDGYFNVKPKAGLKVSAVEPFREKSAGYAFYQRPAANGSRPGIFYINLYNLKSVPFYELESLTYHEAIPGHHFNIAIAQELEAIPEFMKYQRNTAHTEGWGLYCERLAKEMGFYQNPYSDFGRLNMELFRAVRLVVDAGIHYKKWDRQKAVDFYFTNTASSLRRCESMVDRHMVMPGQATAYKVGMNKILELREKAKNKLGDQFDIKDFHDAILKYGLLPLEIVEQNVDRYIRSKKAV